MQRTPLINPVQPCNPGTGTGTEGGAKIGNRKAKGRNKGPHISRETPQGSSQRKGEV